MLWQCRLHRWNRNAKLGLHCNPLTLAFDCYQALSSIQFVLLIHQHVNTARAGKAISSFLGGVARTGRANGNANENGNVIPGSTMPAMAPTNISQMKLNSGNVVHELQYLLQAWATNMQQPWMTITVMLTLMLMLIIRWISLRIIKSVWIQWW